MDKKLKVVWICHFSDSKTRVNIKFSQLYFRRLIRLLLGKFIDKWRDYAVWNSNAIKIFETFKDIELTVVFPHHGIKGNEQRFVINGINYICFRSEEDHFFSFMHDMFFYKYKRKFLMNRRFVKNVINEIKPDLVHVIGAENPYYSITALDIPSNIPSIVSLQTLLSDPDFLSNYPISKDEYLFRAGIEEKVIRHCNYIGTKIKKFRDIIRRDIKPNAIFLDSCLAVGVDINDTVSEKQYDFVYFAANINKAADYAIEAFAIAVAAKPDLTLNISGYYSEEYKHFLDNRIAELGIKDNVFITGEKESHDDVICQIKKSKYALLPLKIDIISGTIREAMACGLPVITTKTPATPSLNDEYESVLLSEIGDYKGMADNMIRLVENRDYEELLRNNAFSVVKKRYNNISFMEELRTTYYKICNG